jgi:hypothetical protein
MPTDLERRINGRVISCQAHGPEAEKALRDRWAPIAVEFETLQRARVQIQENHELTPLGREKAFARLEESAGKVADLLARNADDLREMFVVIRGAETAALTGKKPYGSGYVRDETAPPVIERTPEVLMLEREIRDRLQGDKDVASRYILAVANDDDPVFCSAVENAPKQFQLVPDETLAQAREIRILRSNLAERILMQRALYEAHCFLLEMAFTELYGLFPRLPGTGRADRPALPELPRAPRMPVSVERLLKASEREEAIKLYASQVSR